MMKNIEQRLLSYLEKIKRYINKDRLTTFLVTVITAMIAHFQLYALVLTGPDTLISSMWHLAKGEATLGRFGLYFVQVVKGGVVSPVLATLLSCVILGFTVVLIIDILNIKNKYFKIILALIFAVCPNFSVTLTFFYCSDAYIIAMFLATFAVFVTRKFEENKWTIILGSFCIAVSMGMYQTYLSVAIVLCAATLLVDVLEKKDMKLIIKTAVKYVFMGVLGVILYYIFSHLLLRVWHMQLSNYSGANEIGLSTLLKLPELLPQSYVSFYRYFFTDIILPNSVWHTDVCYIILFFIVFTALIYLVIKNRIYEKKLNFIMIFVILTILPLCFGIIEIMVPKVDIHLLMACSMILVFPIFFKIVEMLPKDCMQKVLQIITITCSIAIIWNYIWQDNASYNVMKSQKEQLEATMNRIVTRIEGLEEYNSDMKIAIIGQLSNNPYFQKYNTELEGKNIYNLSYSFVSNWSVIWDDNELSWNKFMYEYMGINSKIVSKFQVSDILTTDEYKSMKAYPSNDSIKIINNTVVVKLQ